MKGWNGPYQEGQPMTRVQKIAEARRRVENAERMGRFNFRPATSDPEGFNGWHDAVFPTRAYERDRQLVKDADRRREGTDGGK